MGLELGERISKMRSDMLDLTYLYPDEPIEPGDLIILDSEKNPVFVRELKQALRQIGAIWHGSGSTRNYLVQNGTITYELLIGCIGLTRMIDDLDLEVVNEHMKFFRWRWPSHKFHVVSTQQSFTNSNAWFCIHFKVG